LNTIAAIATAHGVGAISIIRMSGTSALRIAKIITKRESLTPRYAHLSSLYDSDDTLIDSALVIYFKNPFSFTGEDIVEFQTHGGIAVAHVLLDRLLGLGARMAQAGEFSKRAYLNGKIDLSEAEAISKIIESKSADAIKVLSRQLKGELKDFVEKTRDNLLEILAYVEVNIDYAEEDLPSDLQEQIIEKVSDIKHLLADTLATSKKREGILNGFKVAIIGKPNVGKSSLLNKMLNFDRAIISAIAGTTRDTIEEEIRIGTHLIKIVDTAGIREASDEIERIGIERSIASIQECDIAIYMFDASAKTTDEDNLIFDLYEQYKEEKDSLVVFNKCDLERQIVLENKDISVIEISAKEDTKEVESALLSILNTKSNSEDLILTSKRQVYAMSMSVDDLDASLVPLEEGELELFAFHINEAILHISNITRPYERDEILDKMFLSFCVGK